MEGMGVREGMEGMIMEEEIVLKMIEMERKTVLKMIKVGKETALSMIMVGKEAIQNMMMAGKDISLKAMVELAVVAIHSHTPDHTRL
ncbi:hypothetical protein ACFXTN_003726 [Malus domestica]